MKLETKLVLLHTLPYVNGGDNFQYSLSELKGLFKDNGLPMPFETGGFICRAADRLFDSVLGELLEQGIFLQLNVEDGRDNYYSISKPDEELYQVDGALAELGVALKVKMTEVLKEDEVLLGVFCRLSKEPISTSEFWSCYDKSDLPEISRRDRSLNLRKLAELINFRGKFNEEVLLSIWGGLVFDILNAEN